MNMPSLYVSCVQKYQFDFWILNLNEKETKRWNCLTSRTHTHKKNGMSKQQKVNEHEKYALQRETNEIIPTATVMAAELRAEKTQLFLIFV